MLLFMSWYICTFWKIDVFRFQNFKEKNYEIKAMLCLYSYIKFRKFLITDKNAIFKEFQKRNFDNIFAVKWLIASSIRLEAIRNQDSIKLIVYKKVICWQLPEDKLNLFLCFKLLKILISNMYKIYMKVVE
jgi:hypothetical protein